MLENLTFNVQTCNPKDLGSKQKIFKTIKIQRGTSVFFIILIHIYIVPGVEQHTRDIRFSSYWYFYMCSTRRGTTYVGHPFFNHKYIFSFTYIVPSVEQHTRDIRFSLYLYMWRARNVAGSTTLTYIRTTQKESIVDDFPKPSQGTYVERRGERP